MKTPAEILALAANIARNPGAFAPSPDFAADIERIAQAVIAADSRAHGLDNAQWPADAPARPRVMVVLEGGNVSAVLSDVDMDVTTIDYDVEGIDRISDLSFLIPQDDGTTAEALRYTFDADVNPDFITAALGGELAMPDDLEPGEREERWVVSRVGPYGVGHYTTGQAATEPRRSQERAKLSFFSATFWDDEGEECAVSFLLPTDGERADREELGVAAIKAVHGEIAIKNILLRDPEGI